MPVTRVGRNVTAVPEDLNRGLDRNTGKRHGVNTATETTHLSGDLMKALAQECRPKKSRGDTGDTDSSLDKSRF
jgi:hypothetical protein